MAVARLLALLPLAALVACAEPGRPSAPDGGVTAALPPPRVEPAERVVRYRCADGSELAVTFAGEGDRATVALPGGASVLLGRTVSGSGARYATVRYVLHIKGEDALWTVGRRAPVACTVAE